MLNKNVLSAVKKGQFHIYSIKHVNDALEVLMGKHPGHLQSNGKYPEESTFGIIHKKLTELREKEQGEEEL
jgi:predicted ATP-dependent protease